MITFVFANQKGGVGKTTLARNFFFFCVEMGMRVLGVDMEAQHNFSDTLLAFRRKTLQAQIKNKAALLEAIRSHRHKLEKQGKQEDAAYAFKQCAQVEDQLRTLSRELLLDEDRDRFLSASRLFGAGKLPCPALPCGDGSALIFADKELVDVAACPLENLKNPKRALSLMAPSFDVCIIDTAPTVGRPLFAALAAANCVVCPCTMDVDSISGVTNLFEDIERVRLMGWNDDLKKTYLVANQVDRRRSFHLRQLDELRAQLPEGTMLDSVLSDRSATNTAKDYPVWQEQTGQSQKLAAQEMKAVCREILVKVGVLVEGNHGETIHR